MTFSMSPQLRISAELVILHEHQPGNLKYSPAKILCLPNSIFFIIGVQTRPDIRLSHVLVYNVQCYRTAPVCSDWSENSGLDELEFGGKRKIR